MQVSPDKQPNSSPAPLQLLLFVDERPSSQQQIQQIQHHLQKLQADYAFDLQSVIVEKQPYLAEQFKVVATPSLIKIYPEPRQTLVGSNLLVQLQNWWACWQKAVEELNQHGLRPATLTEVDTISSVANAAEVMLLTDEIFYLKREQERLHEQLRFKDMVISMLAHDLRNPLTAVAIALETLETHLLGEKASSRLTPALMSQLFKQARTQARTIERMITGLLQVARGTAAELHIQPQKLELGNLCQDALAQVSDRLNAKSQILKTDIPHDLPCVYADVERVRQVLINLLDNAIKYTPVGGCIQVAGLHRTTQKIQLTVCDTGPGIPADNRDRIFEERFRLERDQTIDGYGIGLALCQRIIRAHYGQIWVECPASGGSCFHFTLPVYPH